MAFITVYFTWVAASYRGEARGLWINASPWERSLVKFHLSEFRRDFRLEETVAVWPVTCFGWKPPLLIPSHNSQHLDGTWTRRPSPLPTAMLVSYGEQPQGITPLQSPGGEPRTFRVASLWLTTRPRELNKTAYPVCPPHWGFLYMIMFDHILWI